MVQENPPDVEPGSSQPKLYRIRWYILFLFFNGNLANTLQWIQYSTIANVVKEFYDVPFLAVDWLNMLYYLLYVVFTVPAMWFLKTKGLRWTALIGVAGTALGGWIKLLAVSRDRFYAAMIGQSVSATAQCFVYGLNSEVAALWFGPKEVATADGIGALGAQVGVLLAFFIPIYLVHEVTPFDLNTTSYELKVMLYITSIHATIVTILCLLYFPDKPPQPPSKANAAALGDLRKGNYFQTMKSLLTNRNYLLILFTYAVTNGTCGTQSSLLNQVMAAKFPNSSKEAGIAGVIATAIGVVGAPLVGIIIDRTFKYRMMSNFLLVTCILSLLGYALSVHYTSMDAVYATSAAIGLFSTAYYTFGYDYGAELAYPVPEGLSGILLSSAMSLVGLGTLMLSGWLLREYGGLVCNLYAVAALTVAFIVNLFITNSFKRREEETKVVNISINQGCEDGLPNVIS